MKHSFLTILFLLYVVALFGQKKEVIFLDEAKFEISKKIFNKKLRSKIYYGLKYENDTVVFKVLYLSYRMDKLKQTQKEQLFKLLAQRNKVDTTKSILIHYADTLHAISYFPKNDSIIYYKDGTHTHNPSHKRFVNNHRICNESYTKNSRVYHFFALNEGHPTTFEGQHWYEDNLLLIKNLFGYGKESRAYWAVVIHPNGEFAVRNDKLSYRIWNELVDKIKWEKRFERFDKAYRRLNPLPE